MMNLTYTPAGTDDIEPVFALNKALIDTYEDLDAIDYQRVMLWVRRKIEENICSYTCIIHQGQTAGYYNFHPADGKMELDDLYILPPYRQMGIGTAVLKKCISETSRPVFLYVFARNQRAVALYRRLGFQITVVIKDTRYIMQRE